MVCERPLTLTSQDVSPLFVSDFDAEHCSASQFQIIYLAFLLLYLFCSKPVNISKEKHILQELHLFEQSEQGLHQTHQLIHIISGRTSSCAQNLWNCSTERMEKCEKQLWWGSAMLKHPLKTGRTSQWTQYPSSVSCTCSMSDSSVSPVPFFTPLCGDSLVWEMESTLPSCSSGAVQSDPEGNRISEGFYWIWTLSDTPS